jgi:hypothetical protein
MENLNNLVVNGDNWTLVSANGINDAGVIVGQGMVVLNDGVVFLHGFMLTPNEGPAVLTLSQLSAQLNPASAQPQQGSAFVAAPPAAAGDQTLAFTIREPDATDICQPNADPGRLFCHADQLCARFRVAGIADLIKRMGSFVPQGQADSCLTLSPTRTSDRQPVSENWRLSGKSKVSVRFTRTWFSANHYQD